MQNSVIITGANGGIGQALVTAFHDAGYFVVATDRDSDPVPALACDFYVAADLQETVRNPQVSDRVFSKIRSALSDQPLKGLINNAAIQILGGVADLDRASWQTTLDVNLSAPFFWTQGFLPELIAAKGSVVNISSIHAQLTKRNFVAYSTSKAALSGMTRAMAVDLGPQVRVNAIEPAAIETEMLKAGFEGNTKAYEELKAYHPVGQIGDTSEVGALAVMLVAGDMPFLSGAMIGLHGGIAACLSDPG